MQSMIKEDFWIALNRVLTLASCKRRNFALRAMSAVRTGVYLMTEQIREHPTLSAIAL